MPMQASLLSRGREPEREAESGASTLVGTGKSPCGLAYSEVPVAVAIATHAAAQKAALPFLRLHHHRTRRVAEQDAGGCTAPCDLVKINLLRTCRQAQTLRLSTFSISTCNSS